MREKSIKHSFSFVSSFLCFLFFITMVFNYILFLSEFLGTPQITHVRSAQAKPFVRLIHSDRMG